MTETKRKPFLFKFEEVSVAEAGILAEDLRQAVLDAHPDVAAERKRDDPSAMNFGETLSVILGTQAIVEVGRGVHEWLKRHQSAKIRIERPDGTVVVENLTSRSAVDLVKFLEAK